jgi:hypothetical protein
MINYRIIKYINNYEIYIPNSHDILFKNDPEEHINLAKYAISINANALQYIEHQTEDMCLDAIDKDYKSFIYVKNKSFDFIVKAIIKNHKVINLIKQTPELCKILFEKLKDAIFNSLEYKTKDMYDEINIINENYYYENVFYYFDKIKNPKSEMITTLIKTDCRFIKFINNKKLYSDAVSNNGLVIQYISEQTPELCILAIKNNSSAFHYIKEQTPEICLEAVKKDGMLLKYVKNHTDQIIIEAVKNNGLAIKYVKDKYENICLDAVRNNGLALEFINNQNEPLCIEAVKNNGLALIHVNEQTEEICKCAVKNNGLALQYVKTQTERICILAVTNNPYSFVYVLRQTSKMCVIVANMFIKNPNKFPSFPLYCCINQKYMKLFLDIIDPKRKILYERFVYNSESVLNYLKITITKEFTENCQCKFCNNNKGDIIRLNCGHYYCLHELFKWLPDHTCTCPYCSTEIVFPKCTLRHKINK